MVCHFCGCFLDETVINTLCLKNSNTVKPEERGAYTISTISQEYFNTKRHFFGTPKLDINHANTNNNFNNNLSNTNRNFNEINLNQYIENLSNSEIKEPYYFTSNFIPNKNYHQKVVHMEVTEYEIFKIFEKFYKISKKLGFEIEDSLNKCFKDKKTTKNPFENNIYNLNDTYNQFNTTYNNRTRSRSPPSKNRYNEESFKLGKK